MNTNTFENYLMEVHAEDYHGTDDDMIDNFNAWVENQEASDILQLAEDFAVALNEKLKNAVQLAGQAIDELQKIREIATK